MESKEHRSGRASLPVIAGCAIALTLAGLYARGASSLARAPEPSSAPARTILLPEPIEPVALAAMLMDQAGSYAVFDVRPRWQFDEYHVPNAQPAALEDVADRIRELDPALRPVIVDRDGTVAFAVAGAVLERLGDPQRSVRVLLGGTARFWRDVELAGHRMGRPGETAPRVDSNAERKAAPDGEAPAAAAKKRNPGC